MQITVIGAGNVGSSISRASRAAGHSVTVVDVNVEKAEALAASEDIKHSGDIADAVARADVVVVAVPFLAVDELIEVIRDRVGGKIVLDATNPLNADYSDLVITTQSGAEHIAAQLPTARVVKAFNTVFAANQAVGIVDGVQLDGFYAGDDEQAKDVVRSLLASIGFRPIDVGPLSAALRLEHMAFLNISLNATNGWSWKSAWKLVGPLS